MSENYASQNPAEPISAEPIPQIPAPESVSERGQRLVQGIRLLRERAEQAEDRATFAALHNEILLADVDEVVKYAVDRDITAEYWHHEATHDSLTGLLNRRGLYEKLDDSNPPKAVIFSDGTIKPVNDRISHDRGDEVITDIAKVLRQSTRPDDFIARIGGDEMVIVLDGVQRGDEEINIAEQLELVQQRIHAVHGIYLADPHNADLVAVGYNLAVGGAILEEGMSTQDLINAAEQDMYRVKLAQHQASGYHR